MLRKALTTAVVLALFPIVWAIEKWDALVLAHESNPENARRDE
jgi:hypothetical protein